MLDGPYAENPWLIPNSMLTWFRFLLKKRFNPALKFRLLALSTLASQAASSLAVPPPPLQPKDSKKSYAT